MLVYVIYSKRRESTSVNYINKNYNAALEMQPEKPEKLVHHRPPDQKLSSFCTDAWRKCHKISHFP